MNKDFVTYELAVKLKATGFKEKCIAYYWEKINEHTPSFVVEDNMPEDGLNLLDLLSNHNQAEWSPFIDAPTISQVLKWLREEKLILIGLSPMQEYDGDEVIEWCSTVYKADKQGGLSWEEEFYYQSYEQAALAGIEYVLDNLI